MIQYDADVTFAVNFIERSNFLFTRIVLNLIRYSTFRRRRDWCIAIDGLRACEECVNSQQRFETLICHGVIKDAESLDTPVYAHCDMAALGAQDKFVVNS